MPCEERTYRAFCADAGTTCQRVGEAATGRPGADRRGVLAVNAEEELRLQLPKVVGGFRLVIAGFVVIASYVLLRSEPGPKAKPGASPRTYEVPAWLLVLGIALVLVGGVLAGVAMRGMRESRYVDRSSISGPKLLNRTTLLMCCAAVVVAAVAGRKSDNVGLLLVLFPVCAAIVVAVATRMGRSGVSPGR